jgi:hypothetical protein
MRCCWSGEDDQLNGRMEVTEVVHLMWHAGGTTAKDQPEAFSRRRGDYLDRRGTPGADASALERTSDAIRDEGYWP